ncbi:acetyl-CoA carboxylase biotin carboxylase subunit [Phreatobacter aquaticus]|uniref:Acetyl-CoA carboxylase biotin carboxylase subunit n=1 Tax=Phreatobacter aquaticus TaxID=2570229 RepID=A0A4D7QE98_9HYPH|nr:acetyl-CoA carboxylase biotin carboxylase subunit [Phreatobacter aquaticus]QCK85508.1 acetyl-CoA carboxylase biotin carboxylase subunit [Phreatobacter aquaticus]
MTATAFRTILIANRGEIALRIMATARRMGFATVAVYSDADAEALHVRMADRAVRIGGSRPAESYLNIPAIIEAARRAGADAIHPGYGFLAENAAFARAVQAAGLVFIGPSPQAIDAMGDKAGAKAFMAAAGVPVVPGYQGDDQSEQRLAEEAGKLGFPVMIKAVAGGGGRGMRLVPDAASFAELLRSAKSEAANAFGNDTVLIEKAIVRPRHIEIQVFGDRHGNAIHLGERDCSVQRRHQKLIEEAPSPAVSADLRARMGEVSVKAVQALAYEGAGTLEFLLDAENRFYFMEMNTRLQVEHPVTEAITGLDLVEWQLRVAAGEALPLAQHQVRFEGHAIEVRLCAEDPRQGFMPQSGTFAAFEMESGIRVETALRSGSAVPPFYDSMIAKLIAHGDTREEARRRLISALNGSIALGIATNQGFLARSLAHPVFAEGHATTGFIVEQEGDLLPAKTPLGLPDPALAALVLFVAATPPAYRLKPRHVGPPLAVPMVLDLGGTAHAVAIHRGRDGLYRIEGGGTASTIEVIALEEPAGRAPRLTYRHDGLTETVAFTLSGDQLCLQRGADQIIVQDLTRAAARPPGSDGGDGRISAAMNGRIVAVHVAEGAEIAAGEAVVTLEAMKMEHVHRAQVAGRVAEIAVTAGDQVTTGRFLARIEAAQDGVNP